MCISHAHEGVGHAQVGDKVGVGCFVDSCRECGNCKNGDEQYCAGGMVGTYNGGDPRKFPLPSNYICGPKWGCLAHVACVFESSLGGGDCMPCNGRAAACCLPRNPSHDVCACERLVVLSNEGFPQARTNGPPPRPSTFSLAARSPPSAATPRRSEFSPIRHGPSRCCLDVSPSSAPAEPFPLCTDDR